MRRYAPLAVISFILSITGAEAQSQLPATNAPVTTNAAPVVKVNDDEIVCVKENITGSRIPSSVCHTRHEWDEIRTSSKEFMQKVQDNGTHQKDGS